MGRRFCLLPDASSVCVHHDANYFISLMKTNHLSVRQVILGVQFLFVAFGSTVLVPLLTGLDPATALFSAGIGTLLFHLVTRGQVPIFLGSSFAFIVPIQMSIKEWGMAGAMAGIAGIAVVYFLASALVRWRGKGIIQQLFPPVVIGPVIMLIGLSLTGAAVDMARDNKLLAIITLAAAIVVLMFFKGMLRLLPILIALIVGYVTALCMGEVDFTPLHEAPWLALPTNIAHPQLPEFAWEPFLYMMPIALAVVVEHIGDVYTISNVAEKDFAHRPGLHRTMAGDGLACFTAALLGGPPVTTYSEVTGAIQITKVTNPVVIRVSAVTALLFSVMGKLSGLLLSIPTAVLGGVMMLLFGTIATVGMQTLVRHKVDFTDTRNIIIAGVMLTVGVGGAELSVYSFSLTGVGLSAIVGLMLNLLLPKKKKSAAKKR